MQQSRRLLNLGLDPESADMYWSFGNIKFMDNDYDSNVVQHIPAWSLSALLELMPQRIKGPFGELWHLGLEKDWDKVSYIVYYENKNSFVQRKAKDPIDACIEMIDWLISNGQKLL